MSGSITGLGLLSRGFLVGSVPIAEAQYFGGNKVQYENLAFQVLRTPHFEIAPRATSARA